jgi:serine protease Do
MRRMLACAYVAGVVALAPPAVAQTAATPADFTAMVREKSPAVVAILTRQMIEQQDQGSSEDTSLEDLLRRRFGQGSGGGQVRMALGSGFIVSPEGYIVTNNHVVENAAEIHVRMFDKTDLPARLVGRDPSTDVAVLKIEPRPNMGVASWGDSDRMQPGAWTIAIGSPFGLSGTVSVGVLSARSRDIRSGPYDDYLQTDAAINQGNSGGPLFNAAGEVIGVNTAIYSPSGGSVGIGFAVPSRTARAVSEQIIQNGRVERGFLGARLQELTPALAQALGLGAPNGALVAGLERNGPAEKAGLSTGDVVTKLNGKPIASAHDLSREVAALKPGSQATLSVMREGRSQDLAVTVGQREQEDQPGRQAALETPEGVRMGVELAAVTEGLRRRLGLSSDVKGVLISQVEPGSPAARSGLQPGDVITSINTQPVTQPSDVARGWTSARDQKRPLLLQIQRGEQGMFVAVEG